jgi:transposase
MHYLIKDTEFKKILKFLKEIKGIHKKNVRRLRRFIEGVYYLVRSGCQIRLLPYYYGDWRAIHKRFKEWSERGIWEKMFEYCKQNPDMEWTMIDSTIVRAHACAAGYGKNSQQEEALGRSKGGFTTKIHITTDALGNPLKFILTAGQRHDITQAKKLCENVFESTIIADKGYDCDDFVMTIIDQKCSANIPSKSNRKKPRTYDADLYEYRHIIECFIGKIKHFRRVFSRFDKSAQSYLSFLHFVGALIWIR